MGTFADSIAGALFGKVRLELPLILFLNPDRTYHFSEIRGIVGSGSGAVHRELRNLVNAGLVSLARRANQHRYSVNTESSVCEELRGFLLKTTDLPRQLEEALVSLGFRISAAFICGSCARGDLQTESDVDLMGVGEVSVRDVVGKIHNVQSGTGRGINPAVLEGLFPRQP